MMITVNRIEFIFYRYKSYRDILQSPLLDFIRTCTCFIFKLMSYESLWSLLHFYRYFLVFSSSLKHFKVIACNTGKKPRTTEITSKKNFNSIPSQFRQIWFHQKSSKDNSQPPQTLMDPLQQQQQQKEIHSQQKSRTKKNYNLNCKYI